MANSKYKRVLLKLSGEAFSGGKDYGIDIPTLVKVTQQLKSVVEMGVELAVVVGGGNIWRGSTAAEYGIDRATADYAGMLATVINSLALQDILEREGMVVRTQTAIEIRQVAEPYIRRRAIRHLEKGRVVIFASGTGNPYMTTDTAAALRAIEIEAEVLLMTKNNVDGVYSADPRKYPDATKFTSLTHFEALNKRLEVMDATALSLCLENKLPIIVFDLRAPHSIERVLTGNLSARLYLLRTMMTDQNLLEIEEKMEKTVAGLRKDLATLRTGRATPSLIEHVKVDYAGVPTPLNQLASISAPDARLLVIQPWDKSSIRNIDKAILTSDLGLNPLNDGNVIRISIPPLSEERRQELIKVVHKRVEERKITLRNLRREALEEQKELEKNKEISQDEYKRTSDRLQKLTDSFIDNADKAGRDKEAELKQV